MLYGHTKDRWKWFSIWKTVGVVVFFILLYGGIFIYHALTDWDEQKVHAKKMKDKGGNEDDEDYSPLKSDWQYDEDYNHTISYKISAWIVGIIFFGGAYLLHPYLKPIVSGWLN